MERRDVAGHKGELAPLPAACEGRCWHFSDMPHRAYDVR